MCAHYMREIKRIYEDRMSSLLFGMPSKKFTLRHRSCTHSQVVAQCRLVVGCAVAASDHAARSRAVHTDAADTRQAATNEPSSTHCRCPDWRSNIANTTHSHFFSFQRWTPLHNSEVGWVEAILTCVMFPNNS